MSEDRPKNVLPDGSRTKASIVVLRCQNCRQTVEGRVPMVSVDLVNHERRRAEAAEQMLRACAGDEFALVPTDTLTAVNGVLDRLATWVEHHVPGAIVHRHSGEVVVREA